MAEAYPHSPESVNQETMIAETEVEIDLIQLLFSLLEKWKMITVISVLCAAAAAAYTIFCITPLYQATAKVYVLNSSDSALNLSDLQIGTYLAADYQEVFKTWEVHEMVIQELGLPYSYKQLENMLSVSNPSDTRMLYLTVTSDDPSEAADIANACARAAQKYVAETMETDEPNVFSVALNPSSPSSPSRTRNTLLGFLLGVVASCGIVVVRFLMDDHLRSPDDIERFVGLPTLALIPVRGERRSPKGRYEASRMEEKAT